MTKLKSRGFRLGIAVAVAAATFALAGCSSGGSSNAGGTPSPTVTDNTPSLSASVIAAAKKEGSVTWYTAAAPAQVNAAALAFQNKYGIHVEVVRASTGPLTSRYSSEEQSGKVFADVIMQSDPVFKQTASSDGWFQAIDTKYLPALANVPAVNTDKYSTVLVTIPWGIEYDSSKVTGSSIPKTYKDLLKSQFASNGNLVINDPRAGASQAGLYNWLYVTYGASYLKSLKANNPTVASSLVPALQAMAAGEGEVFLGTTAQSDADLVKAGATLKTITPKQTVGFPHYLGISFKAPHPNAARLFANFLLTPEGQAPLTAGNAISPLGQKLVPQSLPLPPGLAIVDIPQTNQNLPKILALLGLNS